ncbi:ROK family protein [Engelhardtia mirabilis]|uniref:Glucokinase n=1 Tax=Engelhardtia mirabilis TaxID=2528011 RepID=A0A518BQM9_9BACT|nr:Glucokinase [Planctomycetes bacterium Pla133]QDV03613.1 Glucokinase [Planctomycetes bacterium Pla86]
MRALGFDVGGSAVKAGAVDQDGGRRREARREVPADVNFDVLARLLKELADELGPAEAVGVGVPGLLDRAAGRVEVSPNLPWLQGGDLRAAAGAATGIAAARVQVENDANAAALGEAWLGAGRGVDDLLCVTLGTGVGGGLILGGRLVLGAGTAGEIGHVKVDPLGPPCGCGGRGCVETLASATAARRRAIEAGLPADDPGDLEQLGERARAGEAPEAQLLARIGRDLGYGLAAGLNLLDLRTYVIGGGFAAAFDGLEPGIRAGLREGSYGRRVDELTLVRAELGSSAGWIGAARAALVAAGH